MNHNFWTFFEKTYIFRRKIFGSLLERTQLWQNCFLCFLSNVWGNCSPKKGLFLFLENCEKKFQFFGWRFRQVRQNCSLCVQRNTLRKVFSSKSLFSTFCLVERWKISLSQVFFREIWQKLCPKKFYGEEKNLLKKSCTSFQENVPK